MSRPHAAPGTPEQIVKVRELHPTHSASRIAERLQSLAPGLTRNAVIGLWDRLGIRVIRPSTPLRKPRDTEEERARRLAIERRRGGARRRFAEKRRKAKVRDAACEAEREEAAAYRKTKREIGGEGRVVDVWTTLFGTRGGVCLADNKTGCRWPVRGCGAALYVCGCPMAGKVYCTSHAAASVSRPA